MFRYDVILKVFIQKGIGFIMEQEFQPFTEHDVLDELTDINEERSLKVRLDKWLWAARFFKTRALARAAVEAGRIYYNGERSKPSREIEVGALIQVRHGRFEKTVCIKGLSTRRRSTEEALLLFEETEESRSTREQFNESFPQQTYKPRNQFSAPAEPPRERRPVRFLRRSFNRPDISRPAQQPPLHVNRSSSTQQPRFTFEVEKEYDSSES
jgi:ribosome-associated heat shock protein Hsp15